jgi:hypothetical protein
VRLEELGKWKRFTDPIGITVFILILEILRPAAKYF